MEVVNSSQFNINEENPSAVIESSPREAYNSPKDEPPNATPSTRNRNKYFKNNRR